VLVQAPGLLGTGPLPTALLLGTPLAAMLALLAHGPLTAALVALAGVTGSLWTATPIGAGLAKRGLWAAHRARGGDVQLSGMCAPGPVEHRLPGVLAGTRMLSAADPGGQEFAVLAHPRDLWTIVAICAADSPALMDAEHVDARVAGFARLLSAAGAEPGLVCLKTITETTPADPEALRDLVRVNRSRNSPTLARKVMDECAADYPIGTWRERTFVEVTFRGRVLNGTGDEAQVMAELSRRVPGLLARLRDAGAGHAAMAIPTDIVDVVGAAYSPGGGTTPRGVEVEWFGVGPAGAVESWSHYRHDNARSVTWEMDCPPRAAMTEVSLAPLLAPIPGLANKRVAIIHRPDDPGASARRGETDAQAAVFAAGQTKGHVTANATARVRATEQARHEIAAGAVTDRFTVLVTATTTNDNLDEITTAVEAAAGAVPLRLRRCHATQAAAFAATLPVGYLPWEHTAIPKTVRDLM
jgi:hypothetical protein